MSNIPYPEDMRYRRMIAIAIPLTFVLQAIGIFRSLNFDLMQFGIGGYPLFYVVSLIGGAWLAYGIYARKLQ